MTSARETGPEADVLNVAWELLVTRPALIVGAYVLAVSPALASLIFWIRTVAFEDRHAVALASVLVVGGLLLRSMGLVAFQAAVLRLIGVQPRSLARGRSLLITVFRGNAEAVALVGSPFVIPLIVGLACSGVATPFVMSSSKSTTRSLRDAIAFAWHHLGAMTRYTLALGVLTLLVWIGILVSASFLVFPILPSLLSINSADLELAMEGPAWWLGTVLLALCFADMVHNVACCVLAKEQHARENGNDLKERLAVLRSRDGGGP